jgi:hypothetical protein
MAINTLLIRTRRTIGTEAEFITLDAVIRESVQSDITITKNPVEEGAEITDHAIIQPKRYTLEGVVTDTPRLSANIGTDIVNRVTGLFGSSTEEGRSRSNSAYLTLVRIQESRTPFNISTGFQEFRNVLIESIVTAQDKNTSQAFFFTAKLLEVNIVNTKVDSITSSDLIGTQAQTGATTVVERGEVLPQPADQNPAAQTFALRLAELIGIAPAPLSETP